MEATIHGRLEVPVGILILPFSKKDCILHNSITELRLPLRCFKECCKGLVFIVVLKKNSYK
jgi:hypothetical protein